MALRGDDDVAPSGPIPAPVPGVVAGHVTRLSIAGARMQIPALTVAAVARRLGVAPATLRTWDRRYGLGPSAHTAGSHRRYTPDDVARLLVMRGLTIDGIAPSEAARLARESDLHDGGYEQMQRRYTGDGTGTVVGRGRTQDVTPTLVIDAALRGEEATCRALLAPQPSTTVESWWLELVEPVRAGLAARTLLARPGEEADTIVVAAVLAALRSRIAPLARAHVAGRRVVLLLAAPGEPRPLTLHVLAAALAERGVDARVVAGRVEPYQLLEIAVMTRPAAVVLVTERADADLTVVGALVRAQPSVPQFVVVPDGAAATVPLGHTVHRARSFTGLLHEVLAVST